MHVDSSIDSQPCPDTRSVAGTPPVTPGFRSAGVAGRKLTRSGVNCVVMVAERAIQLAEVRLWAGFSATRR